MESITSLPNLLTTHHMSMVTLSGLCCRFWLVAFFVLTSQWYLLNVYMDIYIWIVWRKLFFFLFCQADIISTLHLGFHLNLNLGNEGVFLCGSFAELKDNMPFVSVTSQGMLDWGRIPHKTHQELIIPFWLKNVVEIIEAYVWKTSLFVFACL